MKSQNNAVGDAVFRSAYWNVHVAVHGAVDRAVYWAVSDAMHEVVYRAVTVAVGWAVDEDLPHPALQDFLREVQ